MPRKVTAEDKEAAENYLMPHYGRDYFAEMKASFGQDRELTPIQVNHIILELRRKVTLEAPPEE